MTLATFTHREETRIGVVVGDDVVDLAKAAPSLPTEMTALLEAGTAALDEVRAAGEAATEEGAPSFEPSEMETAPSLEASEAKAAPPAELPVISARAVARGSFATAIVEREPVDSITSLGSDTDRVYYFNEFVGLDGRRVTHRWEYQGQLMAEVPIAISGSRWRAYSSKNLFAGWLGEWTVSVVDESGAVVRTDRFVYEAAKPQPEVLDPAGGDAPEEKSGEPLEMGAKGTLVQEALDEEPASPARTQP